MPLLAELSSPEPAEKIELRREQTETNVTMPVKLPYRVNAQSSRSPGSGSVGWTIRAFWLAYLRIFVTATALRLPGLCARNPRFANQVPSPSLAASSSINMQFPV